MNNTKKICKNCEEAEARPIYDNKYCSLDCAVEDQEADTERYGITYHTY